MLFESLYVSACVSLVSFTPKKCSETKLLGCGTFRQLYPEYRVPNVVHVHPLSLWNISESEVSISEFSEFFVMLVVVI